MGSTCIYCKEEGPFTDEHVFPAGLGGDDGRYMLKGLVCQACNTSVFSKLELAVARRGPEAFARLFLQPEGRGTGKKASIPSLQTEVASFTDPDTKFVLEAELLAGGQPVLLPQVVFSGQTLSVTGSSSNEIEALFESLKVVLTDELHVIKKIGQGSAAVFHVEHYRWRDNGYTLEHSEVCRKPPDRGIWREDLRIPNPAEPGARYVARLFRRRQGQLVLRVLPDIGIRDHVSVLRHERERLTNMAHPSAVSVEKPSMHIGLSVDADAIPRVIAKIGINLVCHEHGESYVRLPAFDAVKHAILKGGQPIRYGLVSHDDPVQQLFAQASTNLHFVMIVGSAGLDGQVLVAAFMRFYGGPVYTVKLAEGDLPERLPVFFTVDYQRHLIERYDVQDWAKKTYVSQG
ncbi:hypothetical protein BOC47_00845 [Burkholderia pseudomallei]|nr:hypothetical protein BOC47_00845 [Burkholderia pseudomallei]